MKITVALVVAAAIAGGLAGAVAGISLDGKSPATDTTPAPVAAELPVSSTHGKGQSAEDIYRHDAAGVVVITATQTQTVPQTLFSPPEQEKVGVLGSGFVIDDKGDILTNDHVIQGGSGVRVGFSSGASYPAHVVGADPSSDVAVVRVNAPSSALDPLRFDDSAAAEVGDPVYAIGNPFGLDRTMTAGIVSATERDIQAPDGETIPDALQTDAPINHGNSGGPLLDRFGGVIGVNDQIEGGTGNNGNVGIGFAVGSDTAGSVAQRLIATGHADHAWLGVEVETIDPSVAKVVRGLPKQGATVTRIVKGSPAGKAGLKASSQPVTVDGIGALVGGDAITAVDGESIATSQQLADVVASHRPGDRVTLTVVRAGNQRKVALTLGNVPAGTS
jgi:S1-C subfamily serine protease